MERAARRRIRPSVEGMESRVTPVGWFSVPEVTYWEELRDGAIRTTAVHPGPAPAPVLSGTAQGIASAHGSGATLAGGGFLSPLGAANARGQLSFRHHGTAGTVTGSLTLSNSKGSLTLKITAAYSGAGSPSNLPDAKVTVSGGSGAFAALRGSGTAAIQLEMPPPGAASGSFSVAFRNITL